AVSALDASTRNQILNLLIELRAALGISVLFISHDMSVVRHIADRVAVMYAGRIVEEGPGEQVFATPQHPYTRRLLDSTPVPDPAIERERRAARRAAPLPVVEVASTACR